MKVLLILDEESLGEFLFSGQSGRLQAEKPSDQPLPIGPDSVALGIWLDQFSSEFDLIAEYLNKFRRIIFLFVGYLLNQFPAEVEDSRNIRNELHEQSDKLEICGQILRVWVFPGQLKELT